MIFVIGNIENGYIIVYNVGERSQCHNIQNVVSAYKRV